MNSYISSNVAIDQDHILSINISNPTLSYFLSCLVEVQPHCTEIFATDFIKALNLNFSVMKNPIQSIIGHISNFTLDWMGYDLLKLIVLRLKLIEANGQVGIGINQPHPKVLGDVDILSSSLYYFVCTLCQAWTKFIIFHGTASQSRRALLTRKLSYPIFFHVSKICPIQS